jgi:hypothetical protein
MPLPENAKQRWCPWSQVLVPVQVGYRTHYVAANRDEVGMPLPGSECLGDKCQAWQKLKGYFPGEGDPGRCGRVDR